MNQDFPYTCVEDCIKDGVAKEISEPGMKCADVECVHLTPIAWIWQSQIFKFEAGRLLMLPVTLWFPLCPKHAPLQEEEVIETTATEVPLAAE